MAGHAGFLVSLVGYVARFMAILGVVIFAFWVLGRVIDREFDPMAGHSGIRRWLSGGVVPWAETNC